MPYLQALWLSNTGVAFNSRSLIFHTRSVLLYFLGATSSLSALTGRHGTSSVWHPIKILLHCLSLTCQTRRAVGRSLDAIYAPSALVETHFGHACYLLVLKSLTPYLSLSTNVKSKYETSNKIFVPSRRTDMHSTPPVRPYIAVLSHSLSLRTRNLSVQSRLPETTFVWLKVIAT